MDQSMKDGGMKEKEKVTVTLKWLMEILTRVSLKKICLMEEVKKH